MSVVSVNALVGETNDSGLNDIRRMRVTANDGNGHELLRLERGIGTSSRVVPVGQQTYRLGVLVQTNFGGILTMGGVPVGKELGRFEYSPRGGDGSCMIVVAADAPLSEYHASVWRRGPFLDWEGPARRIPTAVETSRSPFPRRSRRA